MTRRHTSTTWVGSLAIGSDYPVRVQSMANTDTNDISASVHQAKELADAGAELVRFTTQGMREVQSLEQIKRELRAQGYMVPLVADVHFNPDVADAAAQVVEKVRINPGNYVDPLHKFVHIDYTDEEYKAELLKLKERFLRLIDICKEHNTAIRIGVNHGSLSDRIMSRYGDTPQGMVESCMEFLRVARQAEFSNIVLSVKASTTSVMVETVRLLVKTMDSEDMHYPLHLGVTEAGEGEDARLKSAIGIGSLLMDGIGDTIRVSLSENPVNEIPVAKDILQAAGVIRYKTEYISCPSCGRTLFDIERAIADVKSATKHFKGLKIAVMGCIVNGPGEMADADYGYVGAGRGKVSIYRNKECIYRNIAQEEALEKLVELIEQDIHDHPAIELITRKKTKSTTEKILPIKMKSATPAML